MPSALQPYAIRPATLRHVEQVPGGGGPAASTKPGKRATLNHHAKRTASILNAPDEAALRVHCSADCAAHEALYSLTLNRTISLALTLFLSLALALTLNPNPEP